MKENGVWMKAKQVEIITGGDIVGNFDIGFDDEIPAEVRDELTAFVVWVESNYSIPVTLWVDFEYRHYLLNRDRKRVGYLFYWCDFDEYPKFNDNEDIPEIRLPVRLERSTIDEVLCSFIEALSCYFAWICNIITLDYEVDLEEVEDILAEYKRAKGTA